jgi:hypothetical protein
MKICVEYKRVVYRKYKASEEYTNEYNKLLKNGKEIREHKEAHSLIEKASIYYLLPFDGDELKLDINMAKYDIFKYESMLNLYQRYKNECEDSNIRIRDFSLTKESINDFKNGYILYSKYMRFANPDSHIISILEDRFTFIKDAYNILGCDRVKALKYKVSDIKDEIDKHRPISDEIKEQIKSDFYIDFKGLAKIPVREIKDWLERKYRFLHIYKSVTGETIKEYISGKVNPYRINGISTRCFEVCGVQKDKHLILKPCGV